MRTRNSPKDDSLEDRVRRSRGRQARNTVLSTKMSKSEQAEFEKLAAEEGKALSEWTRDVLLERVRRGTAETAVFTELIALRKVINSVLRRMVSGKGMTEAEFDLELVGIKRDKHRAAAEVMEQYRRPNAGKEQL